MYLKNIRRLCILGCLCVQTGLLLGGCDYFLNEYAKESADSNNEELFTYLLFSGAPCVTVSQLAADYANDVAAADQTYFGKYIIIMGFVYDIDNENETSDYLMGSYSWLGAVDKELSLVEGNALCICRFDEYIGTLDTIEDGDVVAIAGICLRDPALPAAVPFLDRCEYIDRY